MPDPIQEPANPPGQATPPPTITQQAPQTPPTPPAAPATPPAPGTPPVPPAAPNPQLAELQRQNQEAQRKITEQGQQNAELRRQRDALAGVTPKAPAADPLQPFVDALIKKGYDPQQARDMVEVNASMMAPHIEQLQQTQAATQGVAMVQDVMREVYTTNAPLFALPGVFQKVEADLRGQAMRGGVVDVPYALAIAKIEWADAQLALMSGGTPPPTGVQPPAVPPSFASMFGPPGGNGYQPPTPAAPAAPQDTPQQQKWDAEIRNRFLPVKPQA